MKKFIVFIFALLLLIASEYYLLNEIFTKQRLPVMAISLVAVVSCIIIFLRFFKKSLLTS